MERQMTAKKVHAGIRKMLACIMAAVMTIIAFAPQAVMAEDNGLYPADDGAWYYYSGGNIDYTYTGLAQYGEDWWYVENGAINFDYNGLIELGGEWWCVAGGRVAFEYSGLWNDTEVGMWYVENGAINFSYTGQIEYDGVKYTVIDGKAAVAEDDIKDDEDNTEDEVPESVRVGERVTSYLADGTISGITEYNLKGNKIKDLKYNSDGTLEDWSEIECREDGSAKYTEGRYSAKIGGTYKYEYEYDAKGNKVNRKYYYGESLSEEYGYDADDNVVKKYSISQMAQYFPVIGLKRSMTQTVML